MELTPEESANLPISDDQRKTGPDVHTRDIAFDSEEFKRRLNEIQGGMLRSMCSDLHEACIAINFESPYDLEDGVPEWVCLLPAGEVKGRDGRTWQNNKPEKILVYFHESGRDLPIDIEHSTEKKAPRGEPAPAVGWIKELQIRDGAIWGRTEWNNHGKALLSEKAYRYMSPVFLYFKTDASIAALTSVALTNKHNLWLPALNTQKGHEVPKENFMTKILLAALGLPESATNDEAVARITTMKTDLATATNRAENPSLEKFVPRADYDAALTKAANAEQQIKDIKKEQLEGQVESVIGKALEDGKITPATADYHRAQCRQEGGLERFKSYCEAAPTIGGDSGLDKKNPDEKKKALNAQEKEVCATLGISEEDYLKSVV